MIKSPPLSRTEAHCGSLINAPVNLVSPPSLSLSLQQFICSPFTHVVIIVCSHRAPHSLIVSLSLSLFSNLFSFLTVHLVPYLRRLYAGGSVSIHHGKLHFACRQTVLYCLSCCISAQRAGETSGVSEICLLPASGKNSSSIKDSGES